MKVIIIDGIEYNLIPTSKQEVFNDWRLPTIKELLTLVNYDKCSPASDLEDTKLYFYWSGSTHINGSYCAWGVYFNGGNDDNNYKSNSNLVRCVRDGTDGLEWSTTSQDKMTWNEALEYAKNLVAPVYYKG